CDRQAMTALLARIATIATWLSDAQMQDLAVHLSRQSEGTTGKAGQHNLRIALTAANQDQLATLATTAKSLIEEPTGTVPAAGPGVYLGAGPTGPAVNA